MRSILRTFVKKLLSICAFNMGKVFYDRVCSVCQTRGKIIESWGINFCKSCYDTKPKKPNGNGGMVRSFTPIGAYASLDFSDGALVLERVRKSNPVFSELYLTHYPGSKGIMGRSINYLARIGGDVVGIVGANSPPLNYKLFRHYFSCDDEKKFMNNNVYRLVRHDKNLGTRVLALFRKQLQIDYQKQFNETLIGLITFVEPPRSGALYKADNWDLLGETQGKSAQKRDMDNWVNKEWGEGTKKLIFAIKFKRRANEFKRRGRGVELQQPEGQRAGEVTKAQTDMARDAG
jgi:hypothetical protein